MNVIDTQLQNYHIPILGPFILITYRKDILFSFLYTDMSQQVSFLHLFLKFQTEIQFPHWHHSMESSFEKWLYSALLDAPCLVIVVQSLNSFPTLCDSMDCSTPGFPVFTISQSLLKFMSIELVMLSNYLIPCHPHLLLTSVFPNIGSFPMSQFFTSAVQSIGASASASVLSMSIQGWLPLVLTGLVSLLSKGLSRVFSSTTIRKHQFFSTQPSTWSNCHIHIGLLEKS